MLTFMKIGGGDPTYDILCHFIPSYVFYVIICHPMPSYLILRHLVTSHLPPRHLLNPTATHMGYCKTLKHFDITLTSLLNYTCNGLV
jgi:hypothetical protein